MSEKCTPNYKNLNEIQSFGEQRYATVQLMQQACMNEEYLKENMEELSYLTPPAVRKRFSPILLDSLKSYGCQVNQNDEVTFSAKTTDLVTVDFTDFDLIDLEKSDCSFETYVTSGNVTKKFASVPLQESSEVDYSCSNFEEGDQINSFWYCGFDKTQKYHIRPDWIKNIKDKEIPAVCRAQTITIPEGIEDGYLESVDLQIQSQGNNNSNWASPLIVQLRKVKTMSIAKSHWDKQKKKSVYDSPIVYETIYWPSFPNSPLAESVYHPNKITASFLNFKFDKAIKVNAGEHYALVFMSPLSHWDHCPRIGGWGRNCAHDKYEGGDAFLSENNGQGWRRYGRNDDTLTRADYKLGLYTPVDFAFQCHIREYDSGRETDEKFYLYLKPIISNPIKKVTINATSDGDEGTDTDISLVFEVSPTGKDGTWVPLDEHYSVSFSKVNGEYPHMAFVRAVMSTSKAAKTPLVENMDITLDLDSPTELYARTEVYNPKLTPMLGAGVWGRIFAPFEADPTVTGTVEIIEDRIIKEHFDIITAEDLDNYTYIDGLDVDKITDDDIDVRYDYLINNPAAIEILKDNQVYVKPYTHTVSGQSVTEPLSFATGIRFTGSPAYPIVSSTFQPKGTESPRAFSEWIDYEFDYDNDVLNFNEVIHSYYDGNQVLHQEGVKDLPNGTLEVEYNPVFIQDLTQSEVGVKADEKEDGLVLDYFKETFVISDTEIQNRRIPLRVAPVDPIREVKIGDLELHEDIDFTVDYNTFELVFPVNSTDNTSTILDEHIREVLTVVYTPNLESTGISIGYRAKRTNKDKNIRIKSNYIEYKV